MLMFWNTFKLNLLNYEFITSLPPEELTRECWKRVEHKEGSSNIFEDSHSVYS